ncbi:hypothetical protein Aduo_015170 [Ancylostoma duodenale]
MTALLQCVISASSRCPEELTLDKKIIYATPCLTNGSSVFEGGQKEDLMEHQLFCEKQQCSDSANKFCMYDTPIALYNFSNTRSSDLLIPIRAWGTTTREFYPHNSDAQAQTVFISAKCSKGGVEIRSDREIDNIEACISSYCVFAPHISTTSLVFPTELVVFEYTVKITA